MKYFLILMTVLLVSNTTQAQAKEFYNPEGVWLTENKRSVIKIDQKMCGLEIMRGLKQSNQNKNHWLDGEIYKADDGDIYSAKLQIKSPDTITVRGYRGISLLGKSQDWQRVSAKNYPACK